MPRSQGNNANFPVAKKLLTRRQPQNQKDFLNLWQCAFMIFH